MKILYLHIGTSKTATSSIQKFCVENKTVLAEKGYWYPDAIRAYPAVSRNRNAHFLIGNILDEEGNHDVSEEEHAFHLGMENLHRCFQDYDNVILSDERIWFASGRSHKEIWDTLKQDAKEQGYTIKIIVYLRRQDTFLSSRWNQLVKAGSCTESWEKHVRGSSKRLSHILDYAKKIDSIADVFGKENMIVRRFGREHFYQDSVYADFLQCLGLELTDEYQEPEMDVNPAMKGNTFEILRIMNTAPVLNKYNKAYWWKLVSLCSEESDKRYQYSMFSKEEAEEFLERYREGNERIAREYIGDGKPLFDYTVEDLPKWDKDNAYMMEDVIRVFTVISYDFHEEIVRLKAENDMLKNEIRINRPIMLRGIRLLKRIVRSIIGEGRGDNQNDSKEGAYI